VFAREGLTRRPHNQTVAMLAQLLRGQPKSADLTLQQNAGLVILPA